MSTLVAGSCGLCATWGRVTGMGVCAVCREEVYRMRRGTMAEGVCRRCGWTTVLASDSTCRCCRTVVRLGEDEQWLAAELQRRELPSGRPLQLALGIEGL
ncbi:hypothetical protein J7F03_40550 [Streptomyces sp. ISL-43]|uniref:hypothetical protein n=1 Tax=Streptomyces sp. ISL-43 TaxID=2819183 RepID=UPI001BE8FF7A|nr:hypothetical protein [Streptomyces sp. ISL-43]MBT2453196.1 hypothetical protein [Streptomyces sp. ISL-43]